MKMIDRIKSFSLLEFIDESNDYDQLSSTLSNADISMLYSKISRILMNFSDWVIEKYNKEHISQNVYEVSMSIFLEIFISHMFTETYIEEEPYDAQLVFENLADTIINELEGFVLFNGIESNKAIDFLTNELYNSIDDELSAYLDSLFNLADVSLKNEFVSRKKVFTIVPLDIVYNRNRGRAVCKLLTIYND